jgi:hypothetical protein
VLSLVVMDTEYGVIGWDGSTSGERIHKAMLGDGLGYQLFGVGYGITTDSTEHTQYRMSKL